MYRAGQLTRRALVRIGSTALLRPVASVLLRLLKRSGRLLKAMLEETAQSPVQPLDLQGLVAVETVGDAVERSLLHAKEPLPFLVPAVRVVWGYGFRHTADEHPWIAHLQEADGTLGHFYSRYRPADILEAFGPSARPSRGAGAETDALLTDEMSSNPWLFSGRFGSARQDFMGEQTNGTFMGREHGRQHLGPVSREKLIATSEALYRVRDSLKKNGYRPDIGGWIRGYFLVYGTEYLFLICGGQHRSAAWVALGNETIPVILQPGYPRLVDVDRLDHKNRQIALCYFNNRYREARRQLVRNSMANY